MALITYDAASKWLASRQNLSTAMGSGELAVNLASAVKVRSFFSAKVGEAHILDELRKVSDQFSAGTIDRASARAELKTFLAGQGYKPDDVAATPPDGVSFKDWERNNAISNLASTARLDLILTQNARMAAAVGKYETGMDPDIKERFPNWRYITGPNPREDHAALDGLVLPKDDPFWLTHFPPWDYNCNCDVEDCDDEEAQASGGVKQSVNGTVENNGVLVKTLNNESGYEFNVAEAYDSIDTAAIKDPDLRLAAVEQTEIAFGDRVQRQDDGNLKIMSIKQEYSNWEDKGLKSAKTWQALPDPPEMVPSEARSMLEQGIELKAGDGSNVTLGKAVLDHWEIEKGKLPQDIDGRLSKLNWAVETVKQPNELWKQQTQRIYLQVFKRSVSGYLGCLVAVGEDDQGISYLLKSVAAIDKARKGIDYKIIGGS